MENVGAREEILSKIKAGLQVKTSKPYPGQMPDQTVFKPLAGELATCFEQEFTRLLGRLYHCSDAAEIRSRLISIATQSGWESVYIPPGIVGLLPALGDLPFVNNRPAGEADAILTGCECLVARTGTVVLSSALEGGRALSVFAPVHLVVAFTRQLMGGIGDAIIFLKHKYPAGMPSAVAFASGPSRTADIEKTLVVGVHGPREVYLFLLPE